MNNTEQLEKLANELVQIAKRIAAEGNDNWAYLEDLLLFAFKEIEEGKPL